KEPGYLSDLSTVPVPNSFWCAEDFVLGAGMVIIQPSTGKVVILREQRLDDRGKVFDIWFFPKGRKDVGETLEQAALREGHEESGLQVSFLPLLLDHNAPDPLSRLDRRGLVPCTEPIYISTLHFLAGRGPSRNRRAGEYLTFWYVGQVDAHAVVDASARMPDEVNYETFLLTYEEAVARLDNRFRVVLHYAYTRWKHTVAVMTHPEYKKCIATMEGKDAELIAAKHARESLAHPPGVTQITDNE
ncbi:uncharacterized protein BXZ73DRAFT_2616, partial [Epithele typhae]|uniref:uncharacterized protein n=1 Tax=Epithele typhae TaxID=378194 RepID=UPI002008645E